MRLILALSLFAILSTSTLYSQVTIGMDEAPVEGAILQLKQTGTSNTNSTKGLGMPRVPLTELTSLIDISNNPDPVEHTGLIIYNINRSYCSLPEAINPGMYVWNGVLWEALNQEDKNPVFGADYVTDQNNNSYPTMHFITEVNGTTYDAGIWMTENLRATSYDSNITSPPTLTESNTVTGDDPTYYYPKPMNNPITGNPATDRVFFDRHPEFGLMYNWHAAVADKNNAGNLNQGQGEPDEQTEVYQGICPNGWHLPSDREWNMLEKVIALSPEKFSSYPAGSTTWDDAWATTTNFRPAAGEGHGLAVQMPCKLPESNYNNPNGKSLPTYQGGFDVLFVGFIGGGKMESYGGVGIYWSSSNFDSGNAWFRELLLDFKGIDRNHIGKDFLGSVRCKKD